MCFIYLSSDYNNLILFQENRNQQVTGHNSKPICHIQEQPGIVYNVLPWGKLSGVLSY